MNTLQEIERRTFDRGARQIDVNHKRRRVQLTQLEKLGGPLDPETRTLDRDRRFAEPRKLMRVAASVGLQEMVSQAHKQAFHPADLNRGEAACGA